MLFLKLLLVGTALGGLLPWKTRKLIWQNSSLSQPLLLEWFLSQTCYISTDLLSLSCYIPVLSGWNRKKLQFLERWETSMEIVENWLYVHCGILQILGYDCEFRHSEVCSITAFIITLLLLLVSFLLFHRAVVLGYCSITVASRVAELNIFLLYFMKMKK